MPSAAEELGADGIRVNSVQPGIVDDELMEFITAGGTLLDDYIAGMPIVRVGTVEDIAEAVRFLAGPESSWITGVNLPIDGGHHLRAGANYGCSSAEVRDHLGQVLGVGRPVVHQADRVRDAVEPVRGLGAISCGSPTTAIVSISSSSMSAPISSQRPVAGQPSQLGVEVAVAVQLEHRQVRRGRAVEGELVAHRLPAPGHLLPRRAR